MRDFPSCRPGVTLPRGVPYAGPDPATSGRLICPPLPHVSPWAPDLRVALPGGQVGHLQGLLWPEMAVAQDIGSTLIRISRVTKAIVNPWLLEWEHELGEFNRPFGYDAYLMHVVGFDEPVALAISASIVSTTVEGVHRRNVVELARIARHPDHPRALRGMVRMWSEYLAPCWDALPWRSRPDRRWKTHLAIAYALPGKSGNLYRFDGATKVRTCRPSRGGGTYSNPSKANDIADGVKTLWTWSYER